VTYVSAVFDTVQACRAASDSRFRTPPMWILQYCTRMNLSSDEKST
jgi:hypothetical protein